MLMDISCSRLAAQDKAGSLLAAQDNAVVRSRSPTPTTTYPTEQQVPPPPSSTGVIVVAIDGPTTLSPKSCQERDLGPASLLERISASLAAADPIVAKLDN
jgi:hypothetical protein